MSSLIDRITSTARRATRDGALVPVPTETKVVHDHGIDFIIHVTALQTKKAQARAGRQARPINPFLPPDRNLLIDELPPKHVSVLNKFNVLANHLLIVTREFEAQERFLTRDDFSALGRCMSEIDGLGFYNGGTTAGASQPHKHLQLVPLPLEPGNQPTPIDAVVPKNAVAGVPCTVDCFDFAHTLVPLDGQAITGDRAGELLDHYRLACDLVGVRDESRPYNLLLTSRWMLLVPRSREFWRGMSVNALGYAGSLLVRNRQELEELEEIGPVSVLRSVGETRS